MWLTRALFSYDIYICHPYKGNRKFHFSKIHFLWLQHCMKYATISSNPFNNIKKFCQNFCSRDTDDIYIYVMPIKIKCQSYWLCSRMDWLIHWHTSCHVIIIKKWIFEKIKLSVPCVRMTYIYVIGKRPRVNHKC